MSSTDHRDTRAEIQRVALELFSTQGYDKTSLREIAERLGVTKAALYYHFKTKEDIVASTVDDYLQQITDLVDWASAQPKTADTRREIVKRYAELVSEREESMQFFHQNPQLREQTLGKRAGDSFKGLIMLMADFDAPVIDRVRSVMAIFGVNMGMILPVVGGANLDREEVRSAAMQVALELLDRT